MLGGQGVGGARVDQAGRLRVAPVDLLRPPVRLLELLWGDVAEKGNEQMFDDVRVAFAVRLHAPGHERGGRLERFAGGVRERHRC